MHNQEELLRRVAELEHDLKELQHVVNGHKGNYGLALKVDVLWKILAGVVVAICGFVGIKMQNLLSKL